ncbi:hypothetical protein VTL71DRAFT_2722 [Oculimacula yallundae]|uniref:Uncharacterized protein n=1 Tax=Oculimacula yallundae TaxID=86028 RepID=A0ABR4C9R4_9HELO
MTMSQRCWNAFKHGEVCEKNTSTQLSYLAYDPRSIVVFMTGGCAWSQRYRHIQAVFGISFGPNSYRNISSYVPHKYSQCKEIAELFAVSATLRHILEIVVTNQITLPVSTVVICTCSLEIEAVITNPRWSKFRSQIWMRTWGHRYLLRDVLERVEQLEGMGLEIVVALTPPYCTAESYKLLPPIF